MIKIAYRMADDDKTVDFCIIEQSNYLGVQFKASNGVIIKCCVQPEWIAYARTLWLCGDKMLSAGRVLRVTNVEWSMILDALREFTQKYPHVDIIYKYTPPPRLDARVVWDYGRRPAIEVGDYVRYLGIEFCTRTGLTPGAVYRVSSAGTGSLDVWGMASERGVPLLMWKKVVKPTDAERMHAEMWQQVASEHCMRAWNSIHSEWVIRLVDSPRFDPCKVCDGTGKVTWRGAVWPCMAGCKRGQSATGKHAKRWRVFRDPNDQYNPHFASEIEAKREAAKQNEDLRQHGK
jgi:hypothetical protein